MDKLILSLTVFYSACFVSCQYEQTPGGYQRSQPPSNILLHKQALGQDGSFNYAFAADNGLRQGEIINPDGSRRGSYSYVDPNGKTVTLSYTAGKDGFRVVDGDHLPKAPEPQQQRPGPQYYQRQQQQQPQPQNQIYPRPPNYPLFRPEPVPFEAYRNSPDAPAYRGNPVPYDPYAQQPRPVPHGPPAHYEAPYAQPPRPAPPHQLPRQYGVQETDRRGPAPYLPQQLTGEYDQEDPRKPHSFGNGYSFEFAG